MTTVQEAEATLQYLVNQLEEADDLAGTLTASSEGVAYTAFTKGGGAKAKLEKLQGEISEVHTRQQMLAAAIVQAEAILAKARDLESDNFARAQAGEARFIASELIIVGRAMDDAMSAFIGGYAKVQEAIGNLERLGHPAYNNFDLITQWHFVRTLQSAGFDIPVYTGPGVRGQSFETIMVEQERFTNTKTAEVCHEQIH